ncbi:hypothetical protein FocTR4_00015455 [Fusarium oxysporum f. sp. cubense]|uniref:Uncharacterized protein n=1 Tax=Fusarium oxysporum f. sp. cubense TaxID=61366 RepID=A0A5C6SWG9_FUSOC|nr:hypothetical protein FocTR4_00015455 [Fusarium oxysporum f. sp. cubense]
MSCTLHNSLIPVTTLTTKQDVEFPIRSRAFRPAALRSPLIPDRDDPVHAL